MIIHYGFSLTGTGHIKHGIGCQDSHNIVAKDNGINIAAVADGIGSEKHSDISSKMVAESAVEYCANNISLSSTPEEIECTIKEAFKHSWKRVEDYVYANSDDITQYDTTLSLCVLINGVCYYGQSGDGGIIVMTEDGRLECITQQQRDDEGRVFPLCFGEDYWRFGKTEKRVASALLVTDGMLDLFFPVYIQNQEINMYNALISYFIDPYPFTLEDVPREELISNREDYVLNLPANIVDDDKTLVALIDTSVNITRQEDSYYAEPDWVKIIAEWRENYYKVAYENDD